MPREITCPDCGTSYSAPRPDVAARARRRPCRTCHPTDGDNPVSTLCIGCGRPLRDPSRPVCRRCLGATP